MIRFLLIASLVACCSATVSTTVSILRYSALGYSEMENIAHLPYNFQGRSVYNSAPNAVYPASCVFTADSSRCLSATFQGTYENRQKLFVKVTIGNSVFSVPTWQKIPISRYRFNIVIPTAATEMQLTYVVQQKVDDVTSTTQAKITALAETTTPSKSVTSTSTSTSTTSTTSQSTTKQETPSTTVTTTTTTTSRKEIPSTPSFTSNNLLNDERTKKDSFLSSLSLLKFAKKTWNNMTSKLFGWEQQTTTTTTAAPSVTRTGSLTQDSVRDVEHVRTVPQVIDIILKKSIGDRHNPASYDIEAVRKWTLEYHNVFRQKHGMVDFTYDYGLQAAAQRWADHLGQRRSCLVHEQPRVYGENLFFFGARYFPSEEFMAKAMSQAYYMEGVGYDYNRFIPMSYYKTGHFTQLVWKESRRIGVGVSVLPGNGAGSVCNRASTSTYSIYIVVKYDPAGNFQTHNAYIDNVRPPIM